MNKEPIVFFPGIVFHELSHVLACHLTGVKVRNVKWFGVDEAYVQHDKPRALQGLFISIAPFLFGNFLGFELFLFGHELVTKASVFAIPIYWFAFSLLLYSFPSKQDAMNAFDSFVSFYKKKVIEKGSLVTRLLWALTFPVFFVPVILILGFILLFDSAFILRILWVFTLIGLSVYPSTLI